MLVILQRTACPYALSFNGQDARPLPIVFGNFWHCKILHLCTQPMYELYQGHHIGIYAFIKFECVFVGLLVFILSVLLCSLTTIITFEYCNCKHGSCMCRYDGEYMRASSAASETAHAHHNKIECVNIYSRNARLCVVYTMLEKGHMTALTGYLSYNYCELNCLSVCPTKLTSTVRWYSILFYYLGCQSNSGSIHG